MLEGVEVLEGDDEDLEDFVDINESLDLSEGTALELQAFRRELSEIRDLLSAAV
jgi:hypothetical protein